MNTATKLFAILLFLLAVILGVFAVLIARQPSPTPAPVVTQPAVGGATTASAPPTPEVSVVVAARPVAAGRVIGVDDVRLAPWGAMPGGGFSQVTQVVGKVTRFALQEDEAVTQQELASGLALRLSTGERAVAIAVDPVLGVAHQIQPGDWVDVFFTLPRLGADVQRHQARLLLSRVRVLAYGDRSVDVDTPRDGPAAAATAVLAVPIEAINDLLLARGSGSLQLALRSPSDGAVASAALFPPNSPVLTGRAGLSAEQREQLALPENQAYAGLDLPALAGPLPTPAVSPAAPAPPPRAAGPRGAVGTIEVIRGSSKQQEAF